MTETTQLKYCTADSGVKVLRVQVPTEDELSTVQTSLYGEPMLFTEDGETVKSLADIDSVLPFKVALHAVPAQPITEKTTVSLLFALYEVNGKMIGVQSQELELTNTGILYIGEITVPKDKEIGRISLFTTDTAYMPLLSRYSLE